MTFDPFLRSRAPSTAMPALNARSSLWYFTAAFAIRSFKVASGPPFATASMWSNACIRFTAVGRARRSTGSAASTSFRRLRRAASAMPKAAAQPMSGAPRSTMSVVALATSAAVRQVTYLTWRGSRRWSRTRRRSPFQAMWRMGSWWSGLRLIGAAIVGFSTAL
jgi:hypothetical protein